MTARDIHIVEDDDAVRASLTALMMLRTDVTVRSYKSANAFLQSADKPDSGVLLLDFRMPGMSGLEMLAALDRDARHFVTIILTGHADIALAIRAMKLGAFDFVEKPVAPQRLQDTIDAALVELDACAAANNRTRQAQEYIAALSAREHDVLLGLIEGKPNKVIAHSLGISPRTIEIHRARLMDKMQVDSLPQALRIAFDAGLLDRPPEQ